MAATYKSSSSSSSVTCCCCQLTCGPDPHDSSKQTSKQQWQQWQGAYLLLPCRWVAVDVMGAVSYSHLFWRLGAGEAWA